MVEQSPAGVMLVGGFSLRSTKMALKKIVSGGQTGADIAGIDAAGLFLLSRFIWQARFVPI